MRTDIVSELYVDDPTVGDKIPVNIRMSLPGIGLERARNNRAHFDFKSANFLALTFKTNMADTKLDTWRTPEKIR